MNNYIFLFKKQNKTNQADPHSELLKINTTEDECVFMALFCCSADLDQITAAVRVQSV